MVLHTMNSLNLLNNILEAPLATDVANMPKRQMALIIPGHNEAMVIQDTIKSAIAAGQPIQDIYMVDDNSDDGTAALAQSVISPQHVLTVSRSGKAGAILKAIKYFRIADRYEWVHIADADSMFESDYFAEFTSHLDPKKYAAATGYVKSLKSNWISKYRAYEYSFGQEITRRLQHVLGVIPVIPGPTSCYRTDILDQLDFLTTNMTEDFDLTLQIHRKKLGRILFIPSAKTLTQDPKDYKDYVKQVSRWYRGFWQGVVERKIGFGFQKIDLYLGYQIIEMFFYYMNILILFPLLLLRGNAIFALSLSFMVDFIIFFISAVFGSAAHKRADVLTAFPLFYILRVTNMVLYLKAFVEVVILKRFKIHQVGWSTTGRRYKITQGTS